MTPPTPGNHNLHCDSPTCNSGVSPTTPSHSRPTIARLFLTLWPIHSTCAPAIPRPKVDPSTDLCPVVERLYESQADLVDIWIFGRSRVDSKPAVGAGVPFSYVGKRDL